MQNHKSVLPHESQLLANQSTAPTKPKLYGRLLVLVREPVFSVYLESIAPPDIPTPADECGVDVVYKIRVAEGLLAEHIGVLHGHMGCVSPDVDFCSGRLVLGESMYAEHAVDIEGLSCRTSVALWCSVARLAQQDMHSA